MVRRSQRTPEPSSITLRSEARCTGSELGISENKSHESPEVFEAGPASSKGGFDGREDLSYWTSYAESAEEAEEWWGDLVGDGDPMVDLWIAQMDEAGFPVFDPEALEASVGVSNVDGACYGVDGSVRATFTSLMNDNIPVLGSVNRRWAEQILELWTGAPRAGGG